MHLTLQHLTVNHNFPESEINDYFFKRYLLSTDTNQTTC